MLVIKNNRVRTVLRIIIPVILIPLMVLLGETVFPAKQHYFISLAVAVLSLLFFATGFEKKNTGTRRLVITAVMTALCLAGRFIPLFKPITAITAITAIYLGGEAGFMVGALSALLSNFYFGQGPWTPFQMLAWGLIGLAAGLLAQPLKKHKVLLLCFGVISGILYSLVMDVWTILWYNDRFDASLYAAAVVTALPHTLLYALSNFAFLWMLAKPFGDKLERIRIKYGI